MALSNLEAAWVNTLARHFGAEPRQSVGKPAPTNAEVEKALAGLADHANAKLMAGVTGNDVRRAFLENAQAAAA